MRSEVFREYTKAFVENEEEKIAYASDEKDEAYEVIGAFQERVYADDNLRKRLIAAKAKALKTAGVDKNFVAGLMMLDLGEEE